ncbi:hypothetical protein BU15DRAFT_72434 [Melanogaster broomeanus]|nr:hypothetical protein BU15DRAFT_72434 [Melanogaster broomeanus]
MSYFYAFPIVEHEKDGVGGTSGSKGKSGVGILPPSSSGDGDDSELLSYWTTRLQVLTVLTAFLSSMDGALFSLTAIQTNISQPASTTSRELAILAYVASFALIRYRLIEEDVKLGEILSSPSSFLTTQLVQRVPRKIVLEPIHPAQSVVAFLHRVDIFSFMSPTRSTPAPPPPLSLLTRCYYTTLCLASVGFVLALIGILAYVWAALKMPVGIFATRNIISPKPCIILIYHCGMFSKFSFVAFVLAVWLGFMSLLVSANPLPIVLPPSDGFTLVKDMLAREHITDIARRDVPLTPELKREPVASPDPAPEEDDRRGSTHLPLRMSLK